MQAHKKIKTIVRSSLLQFHEIYWDIISLLRYRVNDTVQTLYMYDLELEVDRDNEIYYRIRNHFCDKILTITSSSLDAVVNILKLTF